MNRQAIIDSLYAFINQRPGLEPGNYIRDWRDTEGRRAYNQEARSITRDLQTARLLLRQVELREISFPAEKIIEAARHSYSGRLSINVKPGTKGEIQIDYCAGQYFPTEYRKAVCALCASLLWESKRDDIPAAIENKGDYMRKAFRREFGRGIAGTWFR
jgi:hypothetical protein